jgi:hypothetical protein
VKEHMRLAYKILLRLYPADYRASFAAEMVATFEESAEERRGCGWVVFARYALEETTGVVVGAAKEWISRITDIARITSNGTYTYSSADGARRLLEEMRTPWVSRESFFKVADLICDSGMGVIAPQNTLPVAVIKSQERVRFVIGHMVKAIANHEFEKVRFYSNQERKEREQLRMLLEEFKIV